MQGCLLRINNLAVTSIRIKAEGPTGFQIYVEDPDYGPFPLSRMCVLDYLDLAIPKLERERDPFQGWRRVTYDELVKIVQDIQAQT